MTTFCAVHRNSQITFACDGATATSNEIIHGHADQKKYLVHAGSILCIPGSPVFGLALRCFLEKFKNLRLNDELDIYKFLGDFYDYINEYKHFVQTDDSSGPFKSLGFESLIVNRSGIYSTHEQSEVVKHQQFYALGSGKDYALGALRALWTTEISNSDITRKAVEVASFFDPFTNSDIEQIHVKMLDDKLEL